MENEFIVCQKCSDKNPIGNNFCKKCAAPLKEVLPMPNQLQPKAKLPMKKGKGCITALWIVVAVLILIIIIAAVASGGNKSTPTNANITSPNLTGSTPIAQASSTPSKTTPSTPESSLHKVDIYNVNQTSKVEGVEMTITKVEKSNGSQYEKPKRGKEFVMISVKIKNTNVENLSYNPYYFKMQNSKGQLEDGIYSSINTDTALQSGELLKDGEVEGTIVFEEPINDIGLILQYQDNTFFNDAKLYFKIN